MAHPTENRRGFLALAALGGLAAPVLAQGPENGEAQSCGEAVKAATDELRAKNRERTARSRAAYGAALVARFGPSVVDCVQDHTIQIVRQRFESRDLPRRGLDEVKSLLWDGLNPADFTAAVVERTPTRLEYRVTRCVAAEIWRKLGQPELGYAYNCAWDLGFCQGLNPKIRFTRTQTLMRGHACCNHTYELEEQG